MNCIDPTTGGTWIVDPADGHVEAVNGATWLGGLNEPMVNRFGWQQVGTIAGITSDKAADGTVGYQIIVRGHQPFPAGNWFTFYDFPRDGSGKGEPPPAEAPTTR